MQNFDRFYTTSDFDLEYLRNGTRYPKSERYVISNDSSVQPNKSDELWSTILKVVHASLDTPKSTVSTDIFQPLRGSPFWPLKCLHALDTGQGFLAHTANRVSDPSPQKIRANI